VETPKINLDFLRTVPLNQKVAVLAMVIVGMAAVFSGAARVPVATMLMVAEMTGGYQILVPAALSVVLSYITQVALSGSLKYRSLYEAQVESRLDSPVHHLRLVQGAFRILETAAIRDLRGVSLPDLNNLLRFGESISIHGGRGRVFAFTLESPDGSLVGRQPSEAIDGKENLVLIAVVRGEEGLG